MGDFLGSVVIIGGFVSAIYLWGRLTRPRYNRGEIQNSSFRFGPYSYIIGDNIFGPERGHGIQVMLPKLLPEIVIDSHSDGKSQLPTKFILPGQRLTLEGDFNRYFQVYCAPPAANMALTILTPDVMAVLIDASEKFDIRFSGRTLQIFANKRIIKDDAELTLLIEVAQKLVLEIDHKMKSFKDSPENLMPLKVQAEQGGVKFGNRYLRTGSVAYFLFTAMFASVFYIFALWAYLTPNYGQESVIALFFWLGFTIFPCLTILLVVANRAGLFSERTQSPRLKKNLEIIGVTIRIIVYIGLALFILSTFALQN